MQSFAPIGAGLVVVSSLVYASYGIWVKLLGDYFGDFTLAVMRGAMVVLMLLPFALLKKQMKPINWRQDKWLLFWLGLSTFFISAPFYYAVKIIGVGLGTGILYAGIIIGTMLFGKIIGNEHFSKDKWFSIILSVVGLIFIFMPTAPTFGILGLLAALLSGIGSGLDYVTTKYLRYSPQQTTIITWSATVFINVPFLFFIHEPIPHIAFDIRWIYFLLFSIASLIASWLLIKGIKLIDAGTAGILGLLEIVFGVFFGVVFFNEHPSNPVILGMFCIIFAAALPYMQHYNNRKK